MIHLNGPTNWDWVGVFYNDVCIGARKWDIENCQNGICDIPVYGYDGSELTDNYKAALIFPDQKPQSPTFLVFDNYEKILKWNRSLRFGISVCTLANKIKIWNLRINF